MAFTIELTRGAVEELKAVRVFDRRRIVGEMNSQLVHEPTVPTRNRKMLKAALPDFEHVPPVWELRVGEYRVFYDVDESAQTVYVRAGNGPEKVTTPPPMTRNARLVASVGKETV